jgi:hypothetical protein
LSSKLSDFYVGVVDFFAILLPGALLTFLFKDSFLWHGVFAPVLPNLQGGIEAWAVFILAAYLAGHFVFLVASYLDHAYDFLLQRDEKEESRSPFQIFLRRSEAFRNYRDRLRRLLITSGDPRQLPDYVNKRKGLCLGEASNLNMITAFQWARTNVLIRYPSAAVEVQRFEADSKFFRSLVVVLCIVSIALLIEAAWLALVACIILTILSFWGYVKRRWKGVQLTYTFYIASESMPTIEGDALPTRVLNGAGQEETN